MACPCSFIYLCITYYGSNDSTHCKQKIYVGSHSAIPVQAELPLKQIAMGTLPA